MKEFEGKKLLVLGGFTLACDIVRAAQNMGAYVIVADYNPDSPAIKIADKFALISTLDIDALEKISHIYPNGLYEQHFPVEPYKLRSVYLFKPNRSRYRIHKIIHSVTGFKKNTLVR